jgi:hypothetical protein
MRVYLPATIPLLREWLDAGLATPRGLGYSVTPGLREWYREGDAEELEYAAGLAAATAALDLLAADRSAPRRRVVLAVDVADSDVTPIADERAAVRLGAPVPDSRWGSALVDDSDAEPIVATAVSCLDAAAVGDEDASFALDEAAARELGWYAVQELRFLLD